MNLPIAERELRVAARSPRIYRGRVVACVIFGVMTGWLLWAMREAFNQSAAAMAYGFVTSIALMMCMFASNATADAISSEKRGGTLGFLFLTDLKGSDVVFGKLAANGVMAFYGLLAILPVISMPVLVGGIGAETLYKTALSLVNSLFFALSMGLWISAASWDQKRAMGASAWLMILFLWGLPGLAALAEQRFRWIEVATVLKVLSPSYQLQHANPFGVGMMQDRFWTSLGVTHLLAWLALWRACRIVPHAWQDRPPPALGRLKTWWNGVRYGSSEERAIYRRRLLNISAVHWLTSRDRFAVRGVWLFLGVIGLAWIGIWIWINSFPNNKVAFWAVGIPVIVGMQVGLRMRTCSLASEVLARDRFSGALELLLSTSMRIPEVVRGVWLTVARVMVKPAVATIIVGMIVFACSVHAPRSDEELDRAWTAYVCLNIWFVVDFVAAVWTGLWMACIAKQPTAAAGLGVIRLLAIPFVLFMAVMTFMNYFRLSWFFESFHAVFLTWFGICLLNSLHWIRHSRRRFYERLRLIAAERYQPPPSQRRWWRFWEWDRKNDDAGTIVFGRQTG